MGTINRIKLTMTITVPEFFNQNGIIFRPESGGHELRIICPFCGNEKQKCYVQASTGVYYCFHCGIAGKFTSLAERLKLPAPNIELAEYKPQEDTYPLTPIDPEIIADNHKALLDTSILMEYLKSKRGLKEETIKKFKLGFDGRNITIPILQGNGDCMNFKLRPDPTKLSTGNIKEFSIPGRGRAGLYNEKVLSHKQERVIICEGLFDCMLLTQYGYASVTSTSGATCFPKEWIDYFQDCDKIYLCFDNDLNNAGQKAANKIAQLFYSERGNKVWVISLPPLIQPETKLDVADFFLKRGKEKTDFTTLLTGAQKHLATLEYGQYDFETLSDLYQTEFPPDQWIVEHFLPEQSICCIAGLPGTMKSYFTNYLVSCMIQGKPLLNKFAVKKIPVLFIDKENRRARIKSRLQLLGAPDSKEIYFLRGNFLFDDPSALSVVENFIVSHGIKLVILDTLVRMHQREENDASEMNKVFQGLHRLNVAGATVLFIHHFRKPANGYGAVGDVKEMLRGSGDILAQLDTYFTLQIVDGLFLKCEFGKSRDEGLIKPFLIEAVFEQDATHFTYLKELEQDDRITTIAREDEVFFYICKNNPTRKQLFAAFDGRISTSTIDRIIKILKDTKKITQMTNGNKEFIYVENREIGLE